MFGGLGYDPEVPAGCQGGKGKPILELVGSDGNAMAILGKANRAARQAGWSDERRKQVLKEAKSGDYDHLLQTMFKYFEVV